MYTIVCSSCLLVSTIVPTSVKRLSTFRFKMYASIYKISYLSRRTSIYCKKQQIPSSLYRTVLNICHMFSCIYHTIVHHILHNLSLVNTLCSNLFCSYSIVEMDGYHCLNARTCHMYYSGNHSRCCNGTYSHLATSHCDSWMCCIVHS